MHCPRLSHRAAAFTLVELLTVLAIVALVAALLLPGLGQAKTRAHRAACAHQLQQIGLAAHHFAHEHDGKFPAQVPLPDGGTRPLPGPLETDAELYAPAFRQFQALSNELVAPKLLRCPSDARLAAERFALLQSENVSYFAAVNAEWGRTTTVLAGDRNLAVPQSPDYRAGFRWTRELHRFRGNLLFADGHVEQHHNLSLAAVTNTLAAAVLQFPRAQASTGAPDYAPPVAPQNASPEFSPKSVTAKPAPTWHVATPFGFLRVPAIPTPSASSSNVPAAAAPPPAIVNLAVEDDAPVAFGDSALEYLRSLIKRGYTLLLLLLLTLLAVGIWREWQKWQERRRAPPLAAED